MGDSASAASAAVESSSMTHSTPPPPANAAEQSTSLATPLKSLYTPALDSSLEMTCTPVSRGRKKRVSPLQKMKKFLKSRDISPVRYCNYTLVRGKRENTETSLAKGPPSSGCSLRRGGAPPVWATVESPHYVPLSRA